ncbi:MAG: hypothetical protein ACLQMU_02700 [Methanoregula sp.]|uniref:hypothetical protein n=1 Tax=Methanoregula sp. TaxID=2052170 RepID=UPI003C442132
MSEPCDDEVSAFHESGHAVFACLLNIPIKYITIEKPARFRYTVRGSLKLPFNMRAHRIISAAGMKVQKKYFPTVIDSRDGKTDTTHFDNSCKISHIDPSIERREIESFINKHLEDPEVRHKIEILSHELLKKRTIHGKEIEKILDEKIPPELEIQTVDIVASAMKSALSLLPTMGPLMSELVGTIIPNQRFDRLVKYSIQLEKKTEKIDSALLKLALQNENFTELMEESLRQSARSLSDERRSYLASIIKNSLISDDVDFIESKHLLKILGEVNDIEIILLRFFLYPIVNGDREFREKHKKILEPIDTLGNPQWMIDSEPKVPMDFQGTLYKSYLEHLVQLGLLARRYDIDMKTNSQIYDTFSRGQKLSGYDITNLGILLIYHIDCETKIDGIPFPFNGRNQ